MKYISPVFKIPFNKPITRTDEYLFFYENDEARAKLNEKLKEKKVTKWDCLRDAGKILIPAVRPNPITDRFGEAFCSNDAISVWGGAGSGKSTTCAYLALLHFLASPQNTAVYFYTNPADMHPERAWGKIKAMWHDLPKKYTKDYKVTKDSITPRKETKLYRTGIFAKANPKTAYGAKKTKRSGTHPPRILAIIDEGQQSENCLDLKDNMGIAGFYKEIFVGNPTDWHNELGKHSYPADGNIYKTTLRETKSWTTKTTLNGKKGLCIVLDGRDVKELAPFLQKETAESDIIANHGKDSANYWEQYIGRIPYKIKRETLCSSTDLDYQRHSNPKLKNPIRWAGIDWSLATNTGDSCIIYILETGTIKAIGNEDDPKYTYQALSGKLIEKVVCKIVSQHIVPPKKGISINEYITDYIATIIKQAKVPPRNVAADATSFQISLANSLEKKIGGSIHKVNYSGKSKNKNYSYFASEIAFDVKDLIDRQQIFNIDQTLEYQLVSRKVGYKQTTGQIAIESKLQYRNREHSSTDNFDALAVAVNMLKKRGAFSVQRKPQQYSRFHVLSKDFKPYSQSSYHQSDYWQRISRGR